MSNPYESPRHPLELFPESQGTDAPPSWRDFPYFVLFALFAMVSPAILVTVLLTLMRWMAG